MYSDDEKSRVVSVHSHMSYSKQPEQAIANLELTITAYKMFCKY